METLIAERTELVKRMMYADTGAFPGSKAYRAYAATQDALDAFDAAHPEVLAEAQRAHQAKVLGGVDVLGI